MYEMRILMAVAILHHALVLHAAVVQARQGLRTLSPILLLSNPHRPHQGDGGACTLAHVLHTYVLLCI